MRKQIFVASLMAWLAILAFLLTFLVAVPAAKAQTQISGYEPIAFSGAIPDSVGQGWYLPDSVKIVVIYLGDDQTIYDKDTIPIQLFSDWFNEGDSDCDTLNGNPSKMIFRKEFDQMVDTLWPGLYEITATFYNATYGLDFVKSRMYHLMHGSWPVEDLRYRWEDDRYGYIDPNVYDSGIVLETFESTFGWVLGTDSDSSGFLLDETNFLEGNASVKLCASEDETVASMFRKLGPDTLWSRAFYFANIGFDFYVDPALKPHYSAPAGYVLEYVRIIFSDDTLLPLANYTYYDLGEDEIVSEWNSVTLAWKGFTDVGTFSKSDIIRMVGFEIKTNTSAYGGDTCAVSFDNLFHNRRGRPKLILLFCDTRDDHISEAFSLMQKYHFRGVAEVVADYVGTGGRLTLAQLDTLYSEGWDCVNATSGHPASMIGGSENDLDNWITRGYQYCVEHFPRSAPFFTYANGSYDTATVRKVREQHWFACAGTYSYRRRAPNIIGQRNDADSNALFVFPAAGLGGSGTIAEVKAAIDTIGMAGGFAIFSWHVIDPARLDTILAYIKYKRIQVVTFSDMIRQAFDAENLIKPSVAIIGAIWDSIKAYDDADRWMDKIWEMWARQDSILDSCDALSAMIIAMRDSLQYLTTSDGDTNRTTGIIYAVEQAAINLDNATGTLDNSQIDDDVDVNIKTVTAGAIASGDIATGALDFGGEIDTAGLGAAPWGHGTKALTDKSGFNISSMDANTIGAGDIATGGIEAGDFAANAITNAACADDIDVDVHTWDGTAAATADNGWVTSDGDTNRTTGITYATELAINNKFSFTGSEVDAQLTSENWSTHSATDVWTATGGDSVLQALDYTNNTHEVVRQVVSTVATVTTVGTATNVTNIANAEMVAIADTVWGRKHHQHVDTTTLGGVIHAVGDTVQSQTWASTGAASISAADMVAITDTVWGRKHHQQTDTTTVGGIIHATGDTIQSQTWASIADVGSIPTEISNADMIAIVDTIWGRKHHQHVDTTTLGGVIHATGDTIQSQVWASIANVSSIPTELSNSDMIAVADTVWNRKHHQHVDTTTLGGIIHATGDSLQSQVWATDDVDITNADMVALVDTVWGRKHHQHVDTTTLGGVIHATGDTLQSQVWASTGAVSISAADMVAITDTIWGRKHHQQVDTTTVGGIIHALGDTIQSQVWASIADVSGIPTELSNADMIAVADTVWGRKHHQQTDTTTLGGVIHALGDTIQSQVWATTDVADVSSLALEASVTAVRDSTSLFTFTSGSVDADVELWRGVQPVQLFSNAYVQTQVVGVATDAIEDADIATIEVDVIEISGSSPSLLNLKDFADAGYDPSTNYITGIAGTKNVFDDLNDIAAGAAMTLTAGERDALADVVLVRKRGIVRQNASTTAFSDSSGVLTGANNFWNDNMVVFLNGDAAGQVARIDSSFDTQDSVILTPALSIAPAEGDSFAVFALLASLFEPDLSFASLQATVDAMAVYLGAKEDGYYKILWPRDGSGNKDSVQIFNSGDALKGTIYFHHSNVASVIDSVTYEKW